MHPLWDATYIIFHKYKFQFMHPGWDATILPHYCAGSQYCNFNSCARDGRNLFCIPSLYHFIISIHAPAMGATARFRYYLAIYTIFCIYILFFIQSYLIIISILFYLILGNVRKKVFRYSSGLFNIIFHIVFISLQMRTFCFARVIAV